MRDERNESRGGICWRCGPTEATLAFLSRGETVTSQSASKPWKLFAAFFQGLERPLSKSPSRNGVDRDGRGMTV